MGIDIQKQLDLKPYSDKSVALKPVTATSVPKEGQKVDEEKSNAAKWMIGLTATAAIVIGGLYAAKHGHLGADAEKFAKKLFGEGAKEGTKTPKPSSTPLSSSEEQPQPDPLPIITISALAFARKGISRLIKKPNKSLSEIMAEMQKAGAGIEKKGDNLLEIRTGKNPEDIARLIFNPDGTISSIQRATKKASEEIFTFEGGKLKSIRRLFKVEDAQSPLEHIREFSDGKLVAQHINVKLEDKLINISSVEGKPSLYKFEETSDIYRLADCFQKNEKVLPSSIRKVRCESVGLKERIFSPCTRDYSFDRIEIIPSRIHSRELVRNLMAHTEEHYRVVVNELTILRNAAKRGCPGPHFSTYNLCDSFEKGVAMKTVEEIPAIISSKIENKEIAAHITKLIKEDLGSTEAISEPSLTYLISNYETKFKVYYIDNSEKITSALKPLNKCTIQDFINILGAKKVDAKFKNCFDEAGTLNLAELNKKDGLCHVKENMTIFDIIKELTV